METETIVTLSGTGFAIAAVYSLLPFMAKLGVPVQNIIGESDFSVTKLVFTMGFTVLALVMFDIKRHKPAKCLNIWKTFVIYAFIKLMNIMGWYEHRRFEKDSRDLEHCQKTILRKILKRASKTAYYKEVNLSAAASRDMFRDIHLLTTYEHYRPWIDRVKEGEKNVMMPETVDVFCATTGTTSGKSKLFPKNCNHFKSKFTGGASAYLMPLKSQVKIFLIKPLFEIAFKVQTKKTSQGVTVCPVSSLFSSTTRPTQRIPATAQEIPDMYTGFYIQALFALKEREFGAFSMAFGSHAFTFFHLISERWTDLAHDIQYGTINSDIKKAIPEHVLTDLISHLQPDPDRAYEIIKIFERSSEGFVQKIWKNAYMIFALVSGPFSIYRSRLEKFTGNIPLVSHIHIATESVYGVNLWLSNKEINYTILPRENFYEFIDIDSNQCVLANEVQVGHRYELVVTTSEGLYRYRTNDVIEITRFHNQCPVYKLVQRLDDNLSIYAEKTLVSDVARSLTECARDWSNCEIIDYTTTESIHVENHLPLGLDKMCYVIILETTGSPLSAADVEKMDKKLQDSAEAYSINRVNGKIGPLTILYTPPGAFQRLREHVMSGNEHTSMTQFKVPRLIRNPDKLKCLLSKE